MTATGAFAGLDRPARIAATCAAAAVEVGIFWRFGWTPPLPAYVCFAATATLVSATDVTTRRVPNRFVGEAVLAGVVLLALGSGLTGSWWPSPASTSPSASGSHLEWGWAM